MKQAITIFLEKDDEIEAIRKHSVPHYEQFEPHITLVYPFEVKDQKKLAEHISASLKDIGPFTVSLQGVQKSAQEFYLYLLVNKGKEIIMRLHETLNGGMLDLFRNTQLPHYIPHITLGVFASEDELEKAREKIAQKNICFETKIHALQLITIQEDHTLISKKEFVLNKYY